MNRIARNGIGIVSLLVVTIALPLFAATPKTDGSAAGDQVAVDPRSASLVDAVSDWIALLEKGDEKTAAGRWAADERAAKSLTQEWESLRELHKRHDYRRWLKKTDKTPGADEIGDATQFKVGGHDFGHRHIEWVKTRSGWRIANVWLCR